MLNTMPEHATGRLDLYRPTTDDVVGLHAIVSNPDVWRHFPSMRHTAPDQTARSVGNWLAGWQRDGLGTWVARERGTTSIVGYGGCSMLRGEVWNLGYRFAVASQGRGHATELARAAMRRAAARSAETPIVAYLLENNLASAAVAKKLGMTLAHRAPDAGNPDPDAVRLIFTDRDLTHNQLAAALQQPSRTIRD